MTTPPGAASAASCVVLLPGAAQQSRISSPGRGASAAGARHDALSCRMIVPLATSACACSSACGGSTSRLGTCGSSQKHGATGAAAGTEMTGTLPEDDDDERDATTGAAVSLHPDALSAATTSSTLALSVLTRAYRGSEGRSPSSASAARSAASVGPRAEDRAAFSVVASQPRMRSSASEKAGSRAGRSRALWRRPRPKSISCASSSRSSCASRSPPLPADFAAAGHGPNSATARSSTSRRLSVSVTRALTGRARSLRIGASRLLSEPPCSTRCSTVAAIVHSSCGPSKTAPPPPPPPPPLPPPLPPLREAVSDGAVGRFWLAVGGRMEL